MATGNNKRVIILGAGAAGLSTALALAESNSGESGVEVTLVDQGIPHRQELVKLTIGLQLKNILRRL